MRNHTPHHRFVVGLFCTIVLPATAVAAPLSITKDTVLMADHRGSIVFKANNIKLDCGGKKILWNGSSNAAQCLNRYHESVTCGIKVANYDNVRIVDCTVWDARYGFGIWIADSDSPTVIDASILLASNAGIHLIRDTNAYIVGSDLDSNLEGLEMFDNVNAAAFSNTFRNNGDAGIDEEWSSGSSFADNYVTGNGVYGYFGWYTDNTTFFKNQIRNNGFVGSSLNFASWFQIDQENWSSNGNYGVIIDNSKIGTVMNSTGKGHFYCDAKQRRSSSITWSNNTFAKHCSSDP